MNSKNNPSNWLYRGRHLVSLASLTVGYFIYRRMLFYTMINNNEMLDQAQSQQLGHKNFTMKGARMILGHHINMQQNHSLKKQRIIVVGAGCTHAYIRKHIGQSGTAASKKLLDRGFEVVLIDAGEEQSPRDFLLMQPKQVSLVDMFRSMIMPTARLTTHWDILLESYFTLYVINKFLVQGTQSNLQDLSAAEYQQLKLDIPVMQPPQPTLQVSVTTPIQSEEELLSQATCKVQQPQLSQQLDQQILQHCSTTYGGKFHQLNKCVMDKFVFDHRGQTIGVMTNVGFIKGDQIVIAAGYASKQILKKLGYRLPVIAYRVSALASDKTQYLGALNNILSKYIVESGGLTTYEYVDKLYILGPVELGGTYDRAAGARESLVQEFNRLSTLKVELNDFDQDLMVRSITPDGEPIVNKVPGFPNIYINMANNDLSHLAAAQIICDAVEGNPEQQHQQLTFQRFYLV